EIAAQSSTRMLITGGWRERPMSLCLSRIQTILASLDTMSRPIKNTSGIIDGTFPYQVCINLDRRRRRWQQMQVKFARHGIHSVCRFTAIDGNEVELPKDWAHTPGAYGCLRSHVEVVRKARDRRVSSVLIFEDDVAP